METVSGILAGTEVGTPAIGRAQPGLIGGVHDAVGTSPASLAGADFQSNWKSVLEALGAELRKKGEPTATPTSASPALSLSRQGSISIPQERVEAPSLQSVSGLSIDAAIKRVVNAVHVNKDPGQRKTFDHAAAAKDSGATSSKCNHEASNAGSDLARPTDHPSPKVPSQTDSSFVPVVAPVTSQPQAPVPPAPHVKTMHAAVSEEVSMPVDRGTQSFRTSVENHDPGNSVLPRMSAGEPTRTVVSDYVSVNETDANAEPRLLDASQSRHHEEIAVGSPSVHLGDESNGASESAISRSAQPGTFPAPVSEVNIGAPQPEQSGPRTPPLPTRRSVDGARERSVASQRVSGHSESAVASSPQDVLSATPFRETNALAARSESPLSVRGTTSGLADDANLQAREDAFAALDAARSSPSPTWIHAGVHHAEAGYLDPALGWVSVRADAVGGGIHAALVPGSAEAAQSLGTHVAGLNAYLAEHHGQHATVTLATLQDGGGSGVDSGGGYGQNGGRGTADESSDHTRSRASLSREETGLCTRTPDATTVVVSVPRAAGSRISLIA